MAFELRITGDVFVCEGCPGLRAIEDYARSAVEDPSLSNADIALFMLRAGQAAQHLNEAAELADCRSTEKELPPEDAAIPPLETEARIAFAALCPSYGIYKTLRVAKSN